MAPGQCCCPRALGQGYSEDEAGRQMLHPSECSVQGTAAALEEGGVKCERVLKIQEGRPNASDLLKNGDIAMMLLTTKGAPQPCPDTYCSHRHFTGPPQCAACNHAVCGRPTPGSQLDHDFSSTEPFLQQVTSRMCGMARTCGGWRWRLRCPSSLRWRARERPRSPSRASATSRSST